MSRVPGEQQRESRFPGLGFGVQRSVWRSSPNHVASSPAVSLRSLHNQTGCDDLSLAMRRWRFPLGGLSRFRVQPAGIPGGIGGSNSTCIGLPNTELHDRKQGSRYTHPRRRDAAAGADREGVHNLRSSASSLRTTTIQVSSGQLHSALLRTGWCSLPKF